MVKYIFKIKIPYWKNKKIEFSLYWRFIDNTNNLKHLIFGIFGEKIEHWDNKKYDVIDFNIYKRYTLWKNYKLMWRK